MQILSNLASAMRGHMRAVAWVAGTGCAVSLFLSANQQQMYRSDEKLLIASSDVAPGFVQSTVGELSDDQLYRVQQQVLSDKSLGEIADAYAVFAGVPDGALRNRIRLLRNAIWVEKNSTDDRGPDGGRVSVLTISVRLSDPYLAQNIAHEIGHRFLRISTRTRVDLAKVILEFATSQARKLRNERDRVASKIQNLPGGAGVQDDQPADDPQIEIARLRDQLSQIELQMELAAKRVDRAMAAVDLENQRLGHRLVVVDPAGFPIGPNTQPFQFFIAGSILSFFLAMLFAVFLDWRVPLLRTPAQMKRHLRIDPLIALPDMNSQRKRRNRT